MSTTALVIIDLQNDYYSSFDGARWPLVGTEQAAANAARLLETFRQRGDLVVHVRHEFASEAAPFFRPGSAGAQIHSSVAPLADEAVVLKQQINSFKETDLGEILQKAGVTELVIVGAMSHMCIDAVTRAGRDFGFDCTVIHDACATLDLEFDGVKVPAAQVHAAFMAALSFAYAKVIPTNAYLQASA